MNRVPDNNEANGVPINPDANGLINPTEHDEDIVDSFFEQPSVFNNVKESCGNCGVLFPLEELCPVTHFCPKCLEDDRNYEMEAMRANGD